MALPLFLQTIEDSGVSTWLRDPDSTFGFYFVLLLHTFGLALLVGLNGFVDLRLLGFLGDLPLAPLKRFFPIMWVGFAINAATGVLLLLSYPTKSLTNPVFYVKLTLIGFATWIAIKLRKEVFGGKNAADPGVIARGANLAKWSLVLWVAAISAGRLLAYTYRFTLFPS